MAGQNDPRPPDLNVLRHALNKITDQIGLVSISLLLISAACTRLDTDTIPYGLLAFVFSIIAIGLMAFLSAKRMNTEVSLRALDLGAETKRILDQKKDRRSR